MAMYKEFAVLFISNNIHITRTLECITSRKIDQPALIYQLLEKLRCYLLGGLLLLLLLLGISFVLFSRRCFLNNWCGLFSLGFLLDSNKQTNNLLGLDHVVFINLKFTKDIINFGLGHLVSPGHESMLEHLGVNLALLVISLESLNNEVIRVISISSHLLLEHLDHVVIGASTSNFSKKSIELTLAHEDTNIVKSTTKVIFVKLAILVDVH